MLETTIALDHCQILKSAFVHVNLSDPWNRKSLSQAVSHIHTCLTMRVEYVQQSCRDLAPDDIPTFYDTPFDIPEVVKVLTDLAKLSKASILFFYAGFLLCSS